VCTPRARSSQIKSNQIKVKKSNQKVDSNHIQSNQIRGTLDGPSAGLSALELIECKLRCARNAAKPATARANARFVRAMHVVFEVTGYNEPCHVCPEHVCALCNGEELPKGHNCAHNHSICQTCKLLGHVAKDRGYVWTSTSIGLTFCSQNPKAPCNNGRAAASTTHRSRNCALKTGAIFQNAY
jgi:hypothetical protein